ncbi:prominin-1 isoform X1 [Phascolarctos cinereus]|uniref:Prominin-1 isoform X1 n=1 Tax=Phascolarctos cinereus TaxID=38626 RepID=A0A6P5KUN8_PHACI|nr:prominin-1 isoform X1 [Phascolarctos cinereus]XP_020848477.1 prominin-1 isoform X1 [Phascolarctos cinereus]XP_020848488.1 prominin-1 isoform X1 [Phascolarctos cinereus]XP_020848497.1 prominin-1 isoform X1 [Phascolarctos cinereus]XP_020848506.1 prominin-1 isoform X1 [Phascolarctos cinereus]
MAFVLCLLLLLALLGGPVSEGQSVHRTITGTLDLGYLPAGNYETNLHVESGPIEILFRIVRAFLFVVQPNPFPEDLIRKSVQQRFEHTKTDYQKIAHYEIGFIVLAGLGLLFIVLLPLVGLCFCMCRCCNNCGGEMHQRQKKNGDCRRRSFATSLFVVSLIMSISVFCAFATNQHLTTQVRGMRPLIKSNFKDLRTLLTDTPEQIDYLVSQFDTPKNQALLDLDNIGPLLGGRVQDQLGKRVLPALDAVLTMAGAIRETREALENVSASMEILQEGTNRLSANLTNAKENLNNTLNDAACSGAQAASTCDVIRNSLNQLSINANFSRLPPVTSQLAKVSEVLKIDLASLVQKGYAAFNDTPNLVQNQTKNILSDVKSVLDSIGTNITVAVKMLPIQKTITDFLIYLTQTETYIENYFPLVEQYDFYRWLSCLIACCLLILILVFYYLGLLCGACGYNKHKTPTNRGCVSNTGGNFLMAGVGFSFLFSWALMIIVVSTFVLGGNVEKLVCEPFKDKTIFQVLDTPYLFNEQWKNYLSGLLFKNPDVNLTFEQVYSDCKKNKGIYTSLQLDKFYNISKFLTISQYTQDLTVQFESIKINLSTIVLLDEVGKENLLNFSFSGIDGIDFAAYLTEVNKSITKVDLLSFANDLEARAEQLPKGALENALKGHASNIRMIHRQHVIPMEQEMSTLNQSIRLLQKTATELMVKVSQVITTVEGAQFLINNNASSIIIEETKKYMNMIIDYFEQYIQWVKDSIAMDVAACKPLANIIDTAIEIFLCSYITNSVNAFWFGLGGATTFLVPAIIFAVKLSKYYRRMDSEDVYDDVETLPMKNMENGNYGYHKDHLYGLHNPVMTSAMEQW